MIKRFFRETMTSSIKVPSFIIRFDDAKDPLNYATMANLVDAELRRLNIQAKRKEIAHGHSNTLIVALHAIEEVERCFNSFPQQWCLRYAPPTTRIWVGRGLLPVHLQDNCKILTDFLGAFTTSRDAIVGIQGHRTFAFVDTKTVQEAESIVSQCQNVKLPPSNQNLLFNFTYDNKTPLPMRALSPIIEQQSPPDESRKRQRYSVSPSRSRSPSPKRANMDKTELLMEILPRLGVITQQLDDIKNLLRNCN